MRLSTYFDLKEFIPKEIYEQFGEKSIRFLRPEIPLLAQFCREYFKSQITINNWHTGGSFNYSGYRPPDCLEGAKFSSHKLGAAIDIRILDIPALEVQKIIKEQYEKFDVFGLTAMEIDTPTWTHLSIEWTKSDKLILIPNSKNKGDNK